jgi:hypothetical protein
MTSYTATNFINVLDADETATQMEPLINAAISTLNIYSCNISLFTGTAGSMTGTLSSAEFGGVLFVLRVVYASFYKNAANIGSTGVSSLSQSMTDLMSNPATLAMIKDIAMQLMTSSVTTGPQIVVGKDTS